MSLFGHILQNPLDPRAHADIRLMEVVLDFLGILDEKETTGSIVRMFAVTREFKRIAKAVVEKAERGEGGRKRKRRAGKVGEGEVLPDSVRLLERPPQPGTGRASVSSMAGGDGSAESSPHFLSAANAYLGARASLMQNPAPSSPNENIFDRRTTNGTTGLDPQSATGMPGSSWFAQDLRDFDVASEFLDLPIGDVNQFLQHAQAQQELHGSDGLRIPLNDGDGDGDADGDGDGDGTGIEGFQQPFVPPDMWQMTSLETDWDWANLTAGLGVDGFGFMAAGGMEGVTGVESGMGPELGQRLEQEQEQNLGI
jgi:hypothetical protein